MGAEPSHEEIKKEKDETWNRFVELIQDLRDKGLAEHAEVMRALYLSNVKANGERDEAKAQLAESEAQMRCCKKDKEIKLGIATETIKTTEACVKELDAKLSSINQDFECEQELRTKVDDLEAKLTKYEGRKYAPDCPTKEIREDLYACQGLSDFVVVPRDLLKSAHDRLSILLPGGLKPQAGEEGG